MMKNLIPALICLFVVVPCQARTITVDDDGPADFETIQEAINNSNDGDEIIVAEGTYVENINFLGKNITLTSTDPNDPAVVEATIIDGAGSGSVVTFSGGENASCVLTGFTITGGYSSVGGGIYGSNTNANIRNCRIINNQANNSYPYGAYGGGLCGCDGTISDCVISGNTATGGDVGCGGGLFNCDGDIINCEIRNNVAIGVNDSVGGGLFGCDGKIDRCNISNNSSMDGGGGGLAFCGGIISNSIISQNTSIARGGGLYDCYNGNINNCVITNNTAGSSGGGVYNCYSSGNNCIIWGNSPGQIYLAFHPKYSCIQGGYSGTGNISDDPLFALDGYHLLAGSPCIDTGDPGYVPIAGETDIDGDPRVVNGRIDMGADEFALAFPTIGIMPTEFEFNAIWGSSDTEPQVLAIQNTGVGTLNWEIIENCSWLEAHPNNGQSSGEVNEVTISVDISGLDCGMYDCNLTIFDPCAFNNPQIVPVNLHITGPIIELSAMQFEFRAGEGESNPADQILTIRNSGVETLNWAISYDCNWLEVDPNSGSSTAEVDDVTLSVDISGLAVSIYTCNLTISDPNAENSPQTVMVNLHIMDVDGELHVPSEYLTIQAAIDVAVDWDTVIIALGIYTGAGNKNLDFGGKAITVRSTDPEDPCVVTATVIDCQNAGRGFYFHSGEDANSIVAGLTVKNGKIAETSGSLDAYGGGIYCNGASPTIANCYILNNSVYGWDCDGFCPLSGDAYGGGICSVSNSHPTIINCKISGNLAKATPNGSESCGLAYGGGIYCDPSSTVAIYDSKITNNRVRGGMWRSIASWIHYPCANFGGGIYISEGTSSSIKNCVVTNNKTTVRVGEDYEGTYYARSWGAGIYCGAQTTINNCTIYGNNTDPDGVGVWGDGGGIYGNPTVINSIIWGNLANSQISGSANITYSDVESGWAGTGNIDADPCFVDLGKWVDVNDPNIVVEPNDPSAFWIDGDYHLKSEGWRWDQTRQRWDWDYVTSRCIDAGNPGSPLGDELMSVPDDPCNIWGENIRINMGTYGGTAEASMPPYDWTLLSDITNDGTVDFVDFAHVADIFTDQEDELPGDFDRDGDVDYADLFLLTEDWLGETTWHE